MTTSAPRRPLPRSTPSAEGIDAAGVEAFLDALASAPGVEMHSVMLLRHGSVVAEGWWEPFSRDRVHLLYSLSKSFTAAALGLAVDEGRLSLDDPVISFFPEFADEVTDPRSRVMRVRDCAAMSSGHAGETIDLARRADPEEMVRGFLLTPPDAAPGTLFAYNQPCTYTLSAILGRVTGERMVDYLRPRLFDPLGISEAAWQQLPAGRDLGFSGLHAGTEAIALLGQLHLQRGRWGDTAILSPDWVAQATSRQIPNAGEPNPDWSQGYGFQFWMARHGYRGDGAYGQFMVVLPEHDVVLATTGASEDMQAVLDAAWTHLLPALGTGGALTSAGAREADEALAARLSDLHLPAYAASAASAEALTYPDPDPRSGEDWDGRTFDASESVREVLTSLESVQVTRTDGGWSVVLREPGGTVTAAFAPGQWVVTESGTSGMVPVAASGGWVGESLEVSVAFIETPHRVVLRLDPHAGELTTHWHTAPLWAGPLDRLGAPR